MVPIRLRGLDAYELPGGLRVFVALAPLARLRGLALLPELPSGQALLIPGCRSVHTFGMRFALDMVFLHRSGEPVRVQRAVRAGRLAHCRHAAAVLETRAGESAAFLRAGAARLVAIREGPRVPRA